MKKIYLVLASLLIIGFVFRFVGISKGLSYWNDENHTALMSRGILWYGKPVTAIGIGAGVYQIALYYLTATFFKIGDINEVSGRLPSAIAGTILIATVFLITKKLFGNRQAVIAAFLVTFSQIQLAWSTQLRPYVWVELFILLVIYFSCSYFKSTKIFFEKNLLFACIFSLICGLFHPSGLIVFGFIGLVLFLKTIKLKKYKYLLVVFLLMFVAFVIAYYSGPLFFKSYIFSYSIKTVHYRIFITHNYLWLILPAIVGSFFVMRKDKILFILFPLSAFFIFIFANFKINPDYVRYSLPAFPLLYILFSEGIVRMKNVGLIIGVICILAAVKQEKIILIPKFYYSINADMRENPIVDYKSAFQKIKTLIGDKKDVIVIDAWNDRVPYYLPKQNFEMIYSNRGEINYDPFYGEKYIKDIQEFKFEKEKFPSGIVIVENWESHETEEVKAYIRNNLKYQFDINNLPYNYNDKWSVTIYTWGI